MSDAPPLLEVSRLRVEFDTGGGLPWQRRQRVTAVDEVSFVIEEGETLGLVGESGCGKTTVGRSVLRLIPASSGQVRFRGTNLFSLPRKRLQRLRRRMQIIFQDPAGSLNPRMRVGGIVGEPLLVHRLADGIELEERVVDLLERCGMEGSARHRYPHEFSGGQRQRIAIARALALQPDLIVCDEPTSALDVSIQSQILNLLDDLQGEFGIAYLFISHDISVIHHLCHRIAVMHGGRIVEIGDRSEVIDEPRHPYTRELLKAVPAAPAAG